MTRFKPSGYASDITRTYPISLSGQFTPPQRELYSAILGVQKELITLCTEDAHESLNSLHTKSVEMLGKVLRDIGFDLGAGNRQMDRLYPHFLSHPIGIGEFVATFWDTRHHESTRSARDQHGTPSIVSNTRTPLFDF